MPLTNMFTLTGIVRCSQGCAQSPHLCASEPCTRCTAAPTRSASRDSGSVRAANANAKAKMRGGRRTSPSRRDSSVSVQCLRFGHMANVPGAVRTFAGPPPSEPHGAWHVARRKVSQNGPHLRDAARARAIQTHNKRTLSSTQIKSAADFSAQARLIDAKRGATPPPQCHWASDTDAVDSEHCKAYDDLAYRRYREGSGCTSNTTHLRLLLACRALLQVLYRVLFVRCGCLSLLARLPIERFARESAGVQPPLCGAQHLREGSLHV